MTTRRWRAGFILTVAALALAGGIESATAAGDTRQLVSFLFDQKTPAAASGLQLSIDYVNPDNASSKPYAVETVVEHLASGARFDTAVPERCQASDSELMTAGAAACPAGSNVGDGEVDLDTGIDGPGRIVHNEVTEFNNADELILLFEQENGSRVVSRSKIEGGTLTAGAPPLPGGPPDGFTALKRVRLRIDRVTAGGKSYVTTPQTCPANGSWTNTIEFTYRDGAQQSTVSHSPCTPPPKPKLRISVAPIAVQLREPTRFRIRATRIAGGKRRAVPGATVAIGRKRAHTNSDGRATVTETFYRSYPHRARACKAGFRCGETFVAVIDKN